MKKLGTYVRIKAKILKYDPDFKTYLVNCGGMAIWVVSEDVFEN